MFYIMDFQGKRAWEFRPSQGWLKKNDNGHAVSIGFVLGEDITSGQLRLFVANGWAKPTDFETANKSRTPW